MKYYPVQRNWQRLKTFLKNKDLQRILVRDFNKFTKGRLGVEFKPGMVPHDFESCDWYSDRKGRFPEYQKYVKHAACHWLVNFNLKFAMLAAPKRPWRIIRSQQHSTVWDGEETLFDINFLALGVPPEEAFVLASERSEQLEIGKLASVFFAKHYGSERRRRKSSARGKNG